jgi:hypothetical protein
MKFRKHRAAKLISLGAALATLLTTWAVVRQAPLPASQAETTSTAVDALPPEAQPAQRSGSAQSPATRTVHTRTHVS